ncbi:type II secretion system protein, partial [bacterium]|nr:type II secretion system protein [bacterium]
HPSAISLSQRERVKHAFTLAEVFSSHFAGHRKTAFTLAEVLITLGIIGIVAAMTLPAVINKINDRENLQKFKKAYSELSQVKQLLDMEYGGSFTMACNTFDDVCLRDLFAEKMKVIKTCRSNAPNECQEKSYFQNGKQQFYDTNINHPWPMLITNSGYSVKFRFHFPDCASYNSGWTDKDGNLKELKTCGWMQIDTNGKKKPNVSGKDIYFILIYKDKLIPVDSKNCSDEAPLDDCEPLQW